MRSWVLEYFTGNRLCILPQLTVFGRGGQGVFQLREDLLSPTGAVF